MTKSIIAATALAVLALAPIAAATSAYAHQHRPTYRIPNDDPDPKPSSSTYSCTDELGYLRRVHASELAPVKDWTQVWVKPICENEDSMFRTAGNVGKLRSAIATNAATQKALKDKAFRPEDVVGIRMTGVDKLILFVHPFHK